MISQRSVLLSAMLAIVVGWVAGPCRAQTAPSEEVLPTGPPVAAPADAALPADESLAGDWPDAPEGARLRQLGWLPPRITAVAPPALPEEITRAFIIPIHGDIRWRSTYDIISNKIVQARNRGAQIVIFDMDTLGGESRAMNAICDAITQDLANVYTVAYVHPEAFSAGAIISLACDEIVVAPNGVIGNAMPIMLGPEGIKAIPAEERGKIESGARARVRLLTERNGYNQALCEGMITLSMELWLYRNSETGELRIVDIDVDTPQAPWRSVERIDGPKELVTFTGSEAYQIGLADHILADYEALEEHYNIVVEPVTLGMDWAEQTAYIISSMVVTGLLTAIGLMLAFIEIRTPGFGIAGIGAIICFAILFGGRYIVGLAQWWEIALIVLGLVLLIVEVLLIPGFGWAGISGAICLLAGLFAIAVPNAPDQLPLPVTKLDWSFFTTGMMALGLGFVLALATSLVLMRYMPKLPITNRLALSPASHYDEPTVTADSPLANVSVGDVGMVEMMCRPVGKVRFGEELLDAFTEGEYIDVGQKVRLVRADGNRLVVVRISEA